MIPFREVPGHPIVVDQPRNPGMISSKGMTPFCSPRNQLLPIFKSNGVLVAQVDGFTRHTQPPPPHLKEIQGLLPTMTFATGTNNTVEGNRIESHAIGLQLIKETFNKGQTKCGDGSKGSKATNWPCSR